MSAAKRPHFTVPDNINEEYYQISVEILNSFSKYRPPVDLFKFDESIAVLSPVSRKGARLSNEQVDEIARLCAEGLIFVSRSDHHIYSEHIVKQLDLVLLDHNPKESEIVNICIAALLMRYEEYFEQPVRSFFDPLQRDVLVVTEYLMGDKKRINAFMRRLFREHAPAKHAVNSMIAGLWMWLDTAQEIQRKELDSLAVGLLTHDIGMSKMPLFLINRKGPLKNEEREKILHHPVQSVKILQKMDVTAESTLQCAFEHQERLDGSGYPQKHKASAISAPGRLCAVADSFAAMITERPYAAAKNPFEAARELAADARYDQSLARALVGGYATGVLTVPKDWTEKSAT